MKKLVSVMLVAVMVLSLAACGAAKPEDAVNGFLGGIKEWDMDKASKYVVEDKKEDFAAINAKNIDYLNELFKTEAAKMTYEFGEAAVDGDTATLTASITYTDGSDFITAVLTSVMFIAMTSSDLTTEEFDAMMENAMETNKSKLEGKTTTADIEFKLEKTDGGWRITNPDDEPLQNMMKINMAGAIGAPVV